MTKSVTIDLKFPLWIYYYGPREGGYGMMLEVDLEVGLGSVKVFALTPKTICFSNP